MPDTGALIGTPASISASVEPHTEPIDDDPFDSSVSRRAGSCTGTQKRAGSSARVPLRERAVADVAALRPAHEPSLADRVGRKL
jgi:hypothetical protein